MPVEPVQILKYWYQTGLDCLHLLPHIRFFAFLKIKAKPSFADHEREYKVIQYWNCQLPQACSSGTDQQMPAVSVSLQNVKYPAAPWYIHCGAPECNGMCFGNHGGVCYYFYPQKSYKLLNILISLKTIMKIENTFLKTTFGKMKPGS